MQQRRNLHTLASHSIIIQNSEHSLETVNLSVLRQKLYHSSEFYFSPTGPFSAHAVPPVVWRSESHLPAYGSVCLAFLASCNYLWFFKIEFTKCYNLCLPKFHILLKLREFHFYLEVKFGHFYSLMLYFKFLYLMFIMT